MSNALLTGTFRCKRLSYACVKGAVYFSLLSAAWLFRRSDALGLLPVGELSLLVYHSAPANLTLGTGTFLEIREEPD